MSLDEILTQARNEFGIRVDFSLVVFSMALILARLLPVIILTPFLGGESIPGQVRISLGVVLGVVLFPAVAEQAAQIPMGFIPYLALFLKEVFIGFALAFIVDLVFQAAGTAGAFMDMFSGATMAQMMVPQVQRQVTLYSSLKLQLVVVLFLTLNGHHWVIENLADSFLKLPLNEFPRFSFGLGPFFEVVLRVFGDLFRIGLALASPVLLAVFLTEAALGVINRAAPQIQVFFMAMQIKPAVTALMVIVSLHLIFGRFVQEYGAMFLNFRRAIGLLG
ncbi:MAG: flagellar biosynthetic protein FliR [Proteobacteria bacterium]|nr:flagellar biosynthetic protein FliR [Cystobacterineae bacterium]MCL2258752.1 flagellar biosynthetic protein FliR [Cystobacterineae bacterium]MCL2314536.1 flagellar biosynthetic protein FliR [Pseudomonadota bacterium]